MSSNSKTPNLNLNIWAGSDKPKRVDFNYDNETLDTVIGSHLSDTDIHITNEEREKISSPYFFGYYIGDGANTRVIHLDFTPSFLIVFANGVPMSVYDNTNDKVYSFGGIATSLYASAGIFLGENKFTVTESTGVPTVNNYYPRMNTSGYRYQYIALK